MFVYSFDCLLCLFVCYVWLVGCLVVYVFMYLFVYLIMQKKKCTVIMVSIQNVTKRQKTKTTTNMYDTKRQKTKTTKCYRR